MCRRLKFSIVHFLDTCFGYFINVKLYYRQFSILNETRFILEVANDIERIEYFPLKSDCDFTCFLKESFLKLGRKKLKQISDYKTCTLNAHIITALREYTWIQFQFLNGIVLD